MAFGLFRKKRDLELPPLPGPDRRLPSLEGLKLPELPELREGPRPRAPQARPTRLPTPPQLPRLEAPSHLPKLEPFPELPPELHSSISLTQRPKHKVARHAEDRAPVFVRIDKYKRALETIKRMHDKLAELNDTLSTIKELKSREDKIISGWNVLIKETSERIDTVRSALLEPGSD